MTLKNIKLITILFSFVFLLITNISNLGADAVAPPKLTILNKTKGYTISVEKLMVTYQGYNDRPDGPFYLSSMPESDQAQLQNIGPGRQAVYQIPKEINVPYVIFFTGEFRRTVVAAMTIKKTASIQFKINNTDLSPVIELSRSNADKEILLKSYTGLNGAKIYAKYQFGPEREQPLPPANLHASLYFSDISIEIYQQP